MTALLKILPMGLLLFGAVKGLQKAQPLLAATETLAVEAEISVLLQALRLDVIDGQLPDPSQFSDYARLTLQSRNASSSRDLAQDRWGTPYRLQFEGPLVIVGSAGPDRAFGGKDDIRGSVRRN
jgi:hypothetical protein